VQRELFDQRSAQLVVVFHDQNRAPVGHCPFFASLSSPFEHPAAKAQVSVFLGICRKSAIFRLDLRNRRNPVLQTIRVQRKPAERSRGVLTIASRAVPVALGRGGVKANKREGDGATPRGVFRLRRLWWRADRHPRPPTRLPTRRIRGDDGWCEDPDDRHYNQPVVVPKNSKADRLARTDRLYDFVIELDHNTRPRVAGRGSAVYIHVARPGFAPTAGCVALTMPALRQLLRQVGPGTRIAIG
jgi:L,D-peptidoglycan transpeptidase YkuD (ErfK/YbiS/YcfS/YnhG family)